MKRRRSYFIFYSLFSILLLLLLSPTSVLAENRIGINLGGRWNVPGFKQAAQIVGEGGWISLMAYPSGLSPDCGTSLQAIFDIYNPDSSEFYDPTVPRVNIVIRRYNSGRYFTPEDGTKFANMYRQLNTYGQTIYDMPWNEPGHLGSESIGLSSIDQVAQAMVAYLNTSMGSLGSLLGSKVIMIAPMFDQYHRGSECGGELCGKLLFEKTRVYGFDLNQFEIVPINLYIRYVGGQPVEGNTDVTKFGFSGGKEVLALEMGVIDAYEAKPPVYPPDYPPGVTWGGLLSYVFGSFGFRGTTPFAYDPHKPGAEMYLLKPEYAGELQKHKGTGSAPMNAPPQGESLVAVRGDDECLGAIYYAPIGYLDQMNVVAEKEIDPYQPEEPWYWAECWNPSIQNWDMNCVEAKNKMGFSSEAPLYYPQPLQDWHNYIVYHVLPRRVPYHLQDEVVKKVQEGELAAQGWIEFETSGENNDQKRTQITNPRAWLFQAKFVGNLSYATNWIWQSFTGLYNQGKKPTLVRDGRDTHPGYETASDGMVDFGALAGPASGLFAADKTKGSCLGKDPNLDCDAEGACSYRCCEKRMWIEPVPGVGTSVCIQWRDEKEGVWAMRVINPEVNAYSSPALFGHDKIETLNSGWPELANTWSNVANPINGFVPAVARKHDLEIKMGDDCEDLFGSKEIWEEFNQAATPVDKLGKSICSWRYAKTPFSYSYGPFVAGVELDEGMEAHVCAAVLDPKDVEEAEATKQCYAHWPFVGGLNKVYEFIVKFTNTYREYGLALEPSGDVAKIKSGDLKSIFAAAGNAFEVPAGVLIGIANFEGYHPDGPHLFDFTNEQVAEDIDPYCATSPVGARGPMQFMPSQWDAYKNASKEAGVRGADYEPNICSIIDSIYAAAKKVREDVGTFGDSCGCGKGALAESECAQAPAPGGSGWDKGDVYHASCHYYGNCTSNYCETVWQFYQSSD